MTFVLAVQGTNRHRVPQPQPEIAAAGGSSGVADAPERALRIARNMPLFLG